MLKNLKIDRDMYYELRLNFGHKSKKHLPVPPLLHVYASSGIGVEKPTLSSYIECFNHIYREEILEIRLVEVLRVVPEVSNK